MKQILREDHVKLLLHALSVLFLGLCILFSGGRYESLVVIESLASSSRGSAIRYVAKIDKFTGTTLITKIECSYTHQKKNSDFKTFCTKDLVPDSNQF